MKKLFSKIAAVMLGLFTVCSPIYATAGELYIGNEKAFELFSTEKDTCFILQGMNDGEEDPDKKYVLEIKDANIRVEKQTHWLFKSGALMRMRKGVEEKYYHFQCPDNTMYDAVMSSEMNKSTHKRRTVRKQLDPVAKIFMSKDGKNIREVYRYNPSKDIYDKLLFKIRYFSKYEEKLNYFLDDDEETGYAGYYIEKLDDSVVGKVTGRYFPLEVVLYLVLIGEIKI